MEIFAEGPFWFTLPALPALESGPDVVPSVYVCLDLSLFHIKAGIFHSNKVALAYREQLRDL